MYHVCTYIRMYIYTYIILFYICVFPAYLCAICMQCPQWPEGGVRTPGVGIAEEISVNHCVGAILALITTNASNCRAISPALRVLYFQVNFISFQSLVYVDLCVACFHPVW